MVRVTRTLPPGCGGQLDPGDAADLHAGEPHRGPLDEPAHLDELGDEVVLSLEVPRLGAQQVDDREEDPETGEDEPADTDLERELAGVRHDLAHVIHAI